MRFILSTLILLLVASHIFVLDLSLAPGLSAKNAMLYIAATLITLRIVVSGKFQFEMRPFIWCYLLLIAYAIATWLVAALFVGYKNYSLVQSGISLKNNLADPLIFFMTFLLGARSSEDAIKVLKVLLVGGILMHLATLADAFHIYSIGDYEEPESNGRMAGPLGEANQYGDFIAIFLPPMCATMILSRGPSRWFWLLGIAISIGTLLTTASRAAFTAIALSSAIGAYLLRRYLSAEKVLPWLAKAGGLAVLIISLVSIRFGGLLVDRLIGESKAVSVADISSGRTDFWMEAIDRMMSQPISLLTGFGWNTYDIMGFHYSSHSYYLSQWFNLGIPGLILGINIFLILLREARVTISSAGPISRAYLMAFVFSILTVLVVVMFGELFTPMPYVWAYAGLVMRIAVDAGKTVSPAATRPVPPFGQSLALTRK